MLNLGVLAWWWVGEFVCSCVGVWYVDVFVCWCVVCWCVCCVHDDCAQNIGSSIIAADC